jgi:thiamine biosynthesis lipoprotein
MPDAAPLAHRRCRPKLGTLVEIAVPEGHEAAIDAAFDAVAHVHARMSFHEETSDLAALRKAPAGNAVVIDACTVEVLRAAAMLHDRSGGLFDVGVGARLVTAGLLPEPIGHDPARFVGTAADVEILDDIHVRCRRPLLIDLGGIAKGYAVDRAAEALMRAGVPRAIVNAGGDVRVVGEHPECIWLRDADGSTGAAIMLTDGSLATSGGLLERRVTPDGVVTPHVGRDGRPIVCRQSVSVVAPTCVLADAMTKIALAEPSLAATMLDELGGAMVALPDRRAA